jgi:hypothetical protein
MANELLSALPPDEERKATGRLLRDRVKRGDMGRWRPKKDRIDPVDLVEEAHSGAWNASFPCGSAGWWLRPMHFCAGLPR